MSTLLNDVKLGVNAPLDESFDVELLMYSNTVLAILKNLQIVTKDINEITLTTEWSELTDDYLILGMLKSYMVNRIKIIFDPTSSETIKNAISTELSELELRMMDYLNYSTINSGG